MKMFLLETYSLVILVDSLLELICMMKITTFHK